MKASLVLVLLAVCAVSALRSESSYANEFDRFALRFNRRYAPSEAAQRFAIFRANLDLIDQHNAAGKTWTMGVNQFADLTAEEFRAQMVSGVLAGSGNPADLTAAGKPNDELDWRKKGVVTDVQSEGQCGSTWAWSPVTALESAHAIATGNLIRLSTQQIMDCDTERSQGCNGGYPDDAFAWAVAHGVCSDADYPYTGWGGACRTNCTPVARFSKYVDVLPLGEDTLYTAVQINPVNVNVDFGCSAVQFYVSGVVDDPSQCSSQVNHCVTAVGYGTDAGKDYWILKNMWGQSWGENGYVRVVRNKRQCMVPGTSDFPPAYPIV